MGAAKTLEKTKFFIPHTKKSQYEAAYDAILAAIKYQFNWPVTERRIASLTYTHDRKVITARVGKREHLEHHYEIAAILESSLYIVATKSADGEPGPTILVNTGEVTDIVDFQN